MSFLLFLSEAILISLSGVLAPGPITAVTLSKGSKEPWAGVQIAIGHGLVEFPLMALVFFGVGSFIESAYFKTVIGLAGGLFILWMGIGLLRDLRPSVVQSRDKDHSPILAGVFFSIGNPYFLIWWATVGAALIMRSLAFGVTGFIAFGVGHWLCDLGWNSMLSYISFKGGQFFGRGFQRVVFALSGIFLLFIGSRMIVGAVRFAAGI
jgi:threonine/homoserine/homoserine lactone efflux protein